MPKHTTKPFNLANGSDPAHQADVLIQVAILDATLNLFNKTQSNELLTGLKADCMQLVTLIENSTPPPKPKKLTSRFNVVTLSRQVIAKNITFKKAEQLKKHYKTDCLIKFVGMEVAQ